MIKEIEILLRKFILNIYLLFSKNKPKYSKLRLTRESKILLIRLNKIGDALVTTPFIKAVKENIGCTIHVLADEKNHFIFENNSNVAKTFTFSKNTVEIKLLKQQIEKENYDAVFDLHDDVSTTVTLFLGSLSISNKIGFNKRNNKLFTHVVPHLDPSQRHVIERYSEFIKFLGIDFQENEIRIDYTPKRSSLRFADEFYNSIFNDKKFTVGINISAGSEARFWGVERYKKLISYFSKYDVNVLLFCTINDKRKADEIAVGRINIFVNPDFDKFAATISKLDFLFTPDTSVVHLASAFNIPLFGIYVKYKTENVVWSPYNTVNELIVTEEPNFVNLEFDKTINKLKPFFEKFYYG